VSASDEDGDDSSDESLDQSGRKVTIVAPAGARSEDAEFSRTSKRKATPFIRKAINAGAASLSDDEDVVEETEVEGRVQASAKGALRVTIAAPPGAGENTQADINFSRCSKRKATPFTGKGGATVLVSASDEDGDDSSDESLDQSGRKVTIVAPAGARSEDAEFSRTSKRKATPFIRKAINAGAASLSDEEDGLGKEAKDIEPVSIVVQSPAPAVKTGTDKPGRRVVINEEFDEADPTMQRSETFRRNAKHWTNVTKDALRSRSEETTATIGDAKADSEEESSSAVEVMPTASEEEAAAGEHGTAEASEAAGLDAGAYQLPAAGPPPSEQCSSWPWIRCCTPTLSWEPASSELRLDRTTVQRAPPHVQPPHVHMLRYDAPVDV